MRSWRPIHLIELAFLVVGVGCLGWFGWNWFATEVDQTWSSYELDAITRGRQPSVGDFIRQTVRRSEEVEGGGSSVSEAPVGAPAEGRTAEGRTKRQPEKAASAAVPQKGKESRRRYLKRGDMIGRVEVPRLNIRAVVRYGVDDTTLKRAVGFVPGTALPGQAGNVGIAAHRDTHFRNLKGVKQGDTIRFVTPHGTFEYKVDSTKIVLPTNVEVLEPSPEPSLTLVTCYPFNYVGSAPKRFIVRAKQVQQSPPTTADQRRSASATNRG